MSCNVRTVVTKYLPTYADGSRVDGVFTAVCLSDFPNNIAKKTMQSGSPNVTYKCSTMSSGNSFMLGQKVKCQGHNVYVGLQTERIVAAGTYVSYDGFPRCNVPPHKDLPCITSTRPLAAGPWVFPSVSLCTLVSAGVF